MMSGKYRRKSRPSLGSSRHDSDSASTSTSSASAGPSGSTSAGSGGHSQTGKSKSKHSHSHAGDVIVSTPILSHAQLVRLKNHKYQSTSMSLLDPLFQPYWNWLTTKLPMWLAPNLLTTIGLLINILSVSILLFYTPDLAQPVPRWACLLTALSLFIYQSLDAIDGKQARRTKSSSPLGELFDHGCDSLSTVFLSLAVAASCQLGPTKLTFFHCMLASFLFYAVHWRTYVTGSLHFGLIDVTEAEVTMIVVQLISGIWGSQVWLETATIFGYELTWGQILIASTTPFELYSIIHTFRIVIGKYGVGKNGSTVAGTSVLSPAIPIFLALVPMLLVALWSGSHSRSTETTKAITISIYEKYPTIFIMTFGLIATKVTNRLIIAHMTRSEIKFFDRTLIGPMMMMLNQVCGIGISEVVLLPICLGLTIFEVWVYCRDVCKEICHFLNISLFRIPNIEETPQTPQTEAIDLDE